MIHLISALHQCPVSCRTIGQFAPHGSLIRLTCSINPRCEMLHGFDLAEPSTMLANKAANAVGQVYTLNNQSFKRRSPILMCDWVTAAHHLIIKSPSSHYTAFLFHSTLIRNFKMRFWIMKNVATMTYSHLGKNAVYRDNGANLVVLILWFFDKELWLHLSRHHKKNLTL